METTLRLPSGSLELDARLHLPDSARAGCVVCHPHPLYGGDMNNGVVVAIAKALAAANFATLRFNFRGVGSSTGSHGGGTAEVDDVGAAVAALAEQTGVQAVFIAGYSFGSAMALQYARRDSNLAGVAAVAPPLVMFDSAFLAELSMPLLLLAGDQDTYCPAAEFRALGTTLPPTARTTILSRADHFFAGRESEVGDNVRNWAAPSSK